MAGIPSSSRSGPSPQPPRPHLNRVLDGPSGRILCVADIRGQHSLINSLVKETNARAVIHTGDFGFFENSSLERINDRTLRHLLMYSPLLPAEERERIVSKDATTENLRAAVRSSPKPLLSEFPLLLSGKLKLSVPVYTVWGACEDVTILERFRLGEYEVENLHVIDEATSRTLEIGGIKLRLLGLGGAFVSHKLFDIGDGQATIAGGQGTMWTTALQVGELVDTAQRTYDQSETRLLVTHASPGREALLSQLALVLKADLTISAALHFRYGSSWNEFSIQPDAESYRAKLQTGQDTFSKVWDTVKTQVESAVDEQQKVLLEKALSVSKRVPASNSEEASWKNTWNWNLCDAAFGHLVLDIREGRISAELKSQGFNYGYRRAPVSAATATATSTPAKDLKGLPSSAPSPAPGATALSQPTAAENGAKPNGSTTAATVASPQVADRSVTPANGTNGPASGEASAVASPKSAAGDITGKKKKFTAAEKRERKAEREKAAKAAASEGDSGSKPTSPAPGKTASNRSTPQNALSPAPTPAPAQDKPTNDSDAAVSPIDSGVKSPRPSNRRPHHPWTLYVNRLPTPFTEPELRDVFGESKGSITFVKLMWSGNGPHKVQKPVAFVEFKDEESMKAAMTTSEGVKIRDQQIRITVAENRDDPAVFSDGNASDRGPTPSNSGFFRGGGGRGSLRGRGAPRGGGLFAQAQRSLVTNNGTGAARPQRGNSDPKSNGTPAA